jgi:hemerythrin-like domain-containing protein
MTDVIRLLRREHSNIAQLLDVLDRQADLLGRGEAADFDIIEAIVDYFLGYPNLYHHPMEDLVYQKLLVRDPRTAALIGDLRREHEEEAARTREFAAAVRAVLEDVNVSRESLHERASAFIAYQRRHMGKEERLVFPAALLTLTQSDWADIRARITDREDPLFGRNVGNRYVTLRRDILDWARIARSD